MSTTVDEQTFGRESEYDKVRTWRLHVLIEAGYPVAAAEKLADAMHVDLHQACQLLEQGCKPLIAFRILL